MIVLEIIKNSDSKILVIWLGMKENVYLITFLILAVHFLTFIFSIKITLNKYYIYFLDAIMISIVTVSTFISFRTVNQFIHFQF